MAALAGLVGGCASANNLLPQSARNLPHNMSGYQQSVETEYRSINADLNQAIRVEETVVASDPGYTGGYERLASLFILAGQTSSAVDVLKRATARAPRHSEVWVALGQAEAAYGTPKASEHAYRRALSVNAGAWMAWDGLGFVAVSEGQSRSAWRDSQSALDVGGQQGPTMDLRGRVLLQQGDPGGALVQFSDAAKLEPNWWQAYYDEARAQLALGEYKAAGRALRRAARLNPSSGSVWQMKTALSQIQRRL